VVSDAEQVLLGRVATSRAGRDRGDRYIVVATLGDDMVLVADGERRGMGRPKKKNVKHLILHDVAAGLAAKLHAGTMPRDEEIRLALAEAASAGHRVEGQGQGRGPAAVAD
jgi:hypothetical protein